jgi:phage terminase small subunit
VPPLDNQRHERFAQELAKGKTATEAYILAGYKPNDGNAATLKGNQRVLDRVLELQERSAIKTEITIESLIREAGEIQEAAKADGQHSAAVAALTAKAKLAGLWIDKAENTNRNVADPGQVSDAELAAIVEAGGSEGAAKAPVDKAKFN